MCHHPPLFRPGVFSTEQCTPTMMLNGGITYLATYVHWYHIYGVAMAQPVKNSGQVKLFCVQHISYLMDHGRLLRSLIQCLSNRDLNVFNVGLSTRALVTCSNPLSLSDLIHLASNLILSGASLAWGLSLLPNYAVLRYQHKKYRRVHGTISESWKQLTGGNISAK